MPITWRDGDSKPNRFPIELRAKNYHLKSDTRETALLMRRSVSESENVHGNIKVNSVLQYCLLNTLFYICNGLTYYNLL